MAGENLLAIDCGTQSVRALVFNPPGELVAQSRVPIEPYYAPAPGRAEQHPRVYWEALAEACQGLWHDSSLSPSSLAGVSLTAQRSTVINLDEGGNPLRPAIVWLDQRRTDQAPKLSPWWGLVFRLMGASETVAYLQREAEANWIQAHQPEIWERTHKYLFLSGYLTYLLTGRYVDSLACQVGYVPFDYKRKTWSAGWDWKWQAVPVAPDMLPELVAPGDALGEITPMAAAATGIPQGLPLIASASDKACEVLGAGCLEPHQACLSFGTTATVNTTHTRYIEVIPLIPAYPSAVPDRYSLEVQIYRGYWMVSWFKREFGLKERTAAASQEVEPETLFDELVGSVPPGSEGLIVQPYWSPGLRWPGPEARGAVIGWTDVHTRAHLYRAILEGLAFALFEGAERTQRRSRTPITELRVVGGGSQSPEAVKLTAAVFGLPAHRPHTHEASGLGAAMDAAVGLGIHADFPSAVREMTRIGDTFEPDPQAHRLYADLYGEVYTPLYQRLRPLYQRLRETDPFNRARQDPR